MIASTDLQALIAGCRNPWNLCRLFIFLSVSSIRTKIFLKLPSIVYYPFSSYLPYLHSLIEVAYHLCALRSRSSRLSLQLSSTDPNLSCKRIHSKPINLLSANSSITLNSIDDDETESHYFRCSWLPHVPSQQLYGKPVLETLRTLEQFYQYIYRSSSPLAFQAYIISERLFNVSTFIINNQPSHPSLLTSPLRRFLLKDVQKLLFFLEYHPSWATGNHPLNNCRGLFLVSIVLRLTAIPRLASTILRERVTRLFSPDGYLLEGSSHYHLLVHLWLLQIKLYAEQLITPSLNAHLSQLLVKVELITTFLLQPLQSNALPFAGFGDISPDLSPISTLYNLLSLTPTPSLLHSRSRRPSQCSARFISYAESGLYCAEYEHWTAYLHLPSPGIPVRATHSHQDSTSFVLFLDGLEFIVHPGRSSYHPYTPFSRCAQTALCHISLLINDTPPILTERDTRFPTYFRSCTTQISSHLSSDSLGVTIIHNGFSRLSQYPISHERKLIFKSSSLTIEDSLFCAHEYTCNVALNFNLPLTTLEDDRFFSLHGKRVRFEQNSSSGNLNLTTQSASDSSPSGWRSTCYGIESPITSLRSSSQMALPVKITTTFTLI